jgi:hypothetical protein
MRAVSALTFVVACPPGTDGLVDTADQRIAMQHSQPIPSAQDLAKVAVKNAESKSLSSVTG